MSGERPLRADARRNRERVLEAARTAFSAEGSGVPLDEIARRAGVGPGTVHRHFPTKEALFEAVVVDHLRQLADEAEAALRAEDVGSVFFVFLLRMIREAGVKKDLTDVLSGTGVKLSDTTRKVAADLRETFAKLLAHAQRAGAVRADVDAGEVQGIVLAALTAEQAGVAHPGRMAALVCDCLRPGIAERSMP